ncbi:hypothetical protein LI012_11910 [Caldibacillus thermoamylovorans]|nr:hypothetical protein [Caldibacillus thermoamylovorans]
MFFLILATILFLVGCEEKQTKGEDSSRVAVKMQAKQKESKRRNQKITVIKRIRQILN